MEETLIEKMESKYCFKTGGNHCSIVAESHTQHCTTCVLLQFCEELEEMKQVERINVEAFIDSEHNFNTAKAYNQAINDVIAKIKGGQNGNV